MGLVTLDEVAQWLGIDLTGDARSTALLTRFIDTASSRVQTWCRRSFESGAAVAEPHMVDSTGTLYLDRAPVTEVSLVNLVLSDESLLEVLPENYDVDAQSGRLRIKLSVWNEVWQGQTGVIPTRDAQVTYVGGELVCPEQVKEATIHVVSMLWYGRGRDAAAVNQSAGGFTKSIGLDHPSGLPTTAIALLLDYRRILGALV